MGTGRRRRRGVGGCLGIYHNKTKLIQRKEKKKEEILIRKHNSTKTAKSPPEVSLPSFLFSWKGFIQKWIDVKQEDHI
jgi:hypothetical protein